MPGVPDARYAPEEARSRAEILAAYGQTKLAARLRAAAAKAEPRKPRSFRAVIGLGAVLVAVAAGWFLLAREPQVAPQPKPVETADASQDTTATDQSPPAKEAVALAASPATEAAPAAPQDAPSEPARSPSPEAAPTPASEPEAPAASRADAAAAPAPAASPALAASPTAAADAAPAADSPSTAEPKLRLPDIVLVPGGTFAMGGVDTSEVPVHQVTVHPFALGKFPVTVGEWKQCVAAKACADMGPGEDDKPVTNVSFNDTQDYLAWLSRITGKPFRLPSEAEWEYAARGGKHTKYWWGDQMRTGMANCKGCTDVYDATQPMKVGSFEANPFGLFDMGGGVDQWVADSWHKTYQGAPADGSAWIDDDNSFVRVIRSGSWRNDASYVLPGSRDHYDARIRYPTHGFRVALSL